MTILQDDIWNTLQKLLDWLEQAAEGSSILQAILAIGQFLLDMGTLFWSFAGYIFDGIVFVVSFIPVLFDLGTTVLSFITTFFTELFAINPTMTTIGVLMIMAINLVFLKRVWDFVADIQIFGWKIPKL